MIEIGVDGLSRGELQLGALESVAPDTVIPLHLTAIQRSPSLQTWLASWMPDGFRITQLADWFHEAHQAGNYAVPPVTTDWVCPPRPPSMQLKSWVTHD